MKNIANQKWENISAADREELLKVATAIDASTGNVVSDGECIVDFENGLSVSGEVDGLEITIAADAIVYDPAQ